MIKFKTLVTCEVPKDLNNPLCEQSTRVVANTVLEASDNYKPRLDLAVEKGIIEYIQPKKKKVKEEKE